jgi:hypothetical protein
MADVDPLTLMDVLGGGRYKTALISFEPAKVWKFYVEVTEHYVENGNRRMKTDLFDSFGTLDEACKWAVENGCASFRDPAYRVHIVRGGEYS